MSGPIDLKGMCDHYLDMAAKGKETVSVPPDLLITLLERIQDLETDATNLDSYIHATCRQKLKEAKGYPPDRRPV